MRRWWRDARRMMHRLWRTFPWPPWLRDEWQGEAAVALVKAVLTYRPHPSDNFSSWLWRVCEQRVQNAISYARASCRTGRVVSEWTAWGDSGFDAVPDAQPGDWLAAAYEVDPEVARRYELGEPMGSYQMRQRHKRLIETLRRQV